MMFDADVPKSRLVNLLTHQSRGVGGLRNLQARLEITKWFS